MGFDDGECGHGSSTEVLVHLGGSFKQTGVEIEDISWIGFSSWGSSQEKGHLSVGDGLFGEIVVDDESVFSVVSEVLGDGAA